MGMPPKSSVESRLVKHLKVDEDGCWIYMGRQKRRPLISLRVDGNTKLYYVSRVAAWLWKGFDLDNPLSILHHCDKPACCNPDCLWEGTQANNVQDAISKGRFRKAQGEHHGQAKLTNAEARTIRQEASAGITTHQLAKKYGVKQQLIRRVLRGHNYKETNLHA